MNELSQVVDSIEIKLKRVKQMLNALKQENKKLHENLDVLLAKNEKLHAKMILQNEELEILKIAKSMLGSDEYKKETKLKINNIIRELDTCIKQLSV
jgi:predicted nuclease with TOPRIM domain